MQNNVAAVCVLAVCVSSMDRPKSRSIPAKRVSAGDPQKAEKYREV